jgi:hypothetical protein
MRDRKKIDKESFTYAKQHFKGIEIVEGKGNSLFDDNICFFQMRRRNKHANMVGIGCCRSYPLMSLSKHK